MQCRVSTGPDSVEGIHYLLARIPLIISHSWGMIDGCFPVCVFLVSSLLPGMPPFHLCLLRSHSLLKARVKSFPSVMSSGLITLWSDSLLLWNPKKICITCRRLITLCHSSLFFRRLITMYYSSWQAFSSLALNLKPLDLRSSLNHLLCLVQSPASRKYLLKQWVSEVFILLILRTIGNTHNIKITWKLPVTDILLSISAYLPWGRHCQVWYGILGMP